MLLVSAKVGPFKSIDTPQEVEIEDRVTVLVGMNEAGKTVFLQALQKSGDVLGAEKFVPVDDYPRKSLREYEKRHEAAPEVATVLTYQLTDAEVAEVNENLHTRLPKGYRFQVAHTYKNTLTNLDLPVDEKPVIGEIAKDAELSKEFRAAIKSAGALRAIPSAVQGQSLTDADKKRLGTIVERISKTNWDNVVQFEVWSWISARTPKFLYFGDYEVLPSKLNLNDLAQRVANNTLTPEHQGILALLRMANIRVEDFSTPGSLEALIARIESVSIGLTDQIMEFWKQNEDLEVRIDTRSDPADQAPFNNGPNLYIRIANNRHRGVTTPFKQRSRGFIWFFSFLVWFDSVQNQLAQGKDKKRPLILLLDEPGLNLHALAQKDFLKYIDKLAKKHQVIYSTHSPFMIHTERLHDVRIVEDREKVGTVISDNVSWTDKRSIFPLQAALGWTIAQNLFISERNLLVEGQAELSYLESISALLESHGREGLRDDVTIVTTGGLDKLVTFIALLGANHLKLAALHDYRGAPEQKLQDLVRQKMISGRAILDASQFRDLAQLGVSGRPSDIEDLFTVANYLRCFNAAYAKQLGGKEIQEADLPPGDRIVDRLERHLTDKGIQLRPSGGFNHYLPATRFARDPTEFMDKDTLSRFEALFKAVNEVL